MSKNFSFNFKRNEGSGFEIVSEGEHIFIIDKCEFKTSQTGNAMLKVQLSCQDENEENRKVWDNIVFLESCDWKITQFLDGIDYQQEDGEMNMEDIENIIEHAKGAEITVEIKHEDNRKINKNGDDVLDKDGNVIFETRAIVKKYISAGIVENDGTSQL